MKDARQSVGGLLAFLVMLTVFIPFIPFWSMSKGVNPIVDKIFSVFFHIKGAALADFGSFFVMFVNPTMFFVLYSIGLLLSFRNLKYLAVYMKICVMLQIMGCIVVSVILKDLPLISVLIFATLYVVFASNRIADQKQKGSE